MLDEALRMSKESSLDIYFSDVGVPQLRHFVNAIKPHANRWRSIFIDTDEYGYISHLISDIPSLPQLEIYEVGEDCEKEERMSTLPLVVRRNAPKLHTLVIMPLAGLLDALPYIALRRLEFTAYARQFEHFPNGLESIFRSSPQLEYLRIIDPSELSLENIQIPAFSVQAPALKTIVLQWFPTSIIASLLSGISPPKINCPSVKLITSVINKNGIFPESYSPQSLLGLIHSVEWMEIDYYDFLIIKAGREEAHCLLYYQSYLCGSVALTNLGTIIFPIGVPSLRSLRIN
ncbi:hypothetical protein FRC03_005319 [Tulasnella sp. 419]|nr:hypothetical protein FRC03_005319 [Tulasnella sp. 419]